MKKIFFSMFIFCILIIAQGCASSNPPGKVAVSVNVTGKSNVISEENKEILKSRIIEIFNANKEKYTVIERGYEFLAQIQREHEKQRSGAVDSGQISELGKQFSAEFLCVADVVEVYNIKHISARLIDVETAVIVAVGNTESQLENLDDFEAVSNKIVNPMLKVSVFSKSKAKNTESVTNKTEDKPEIKVEDKAKDKVEIKTENKIENRQYNDNYNPYRRQNDYDDDW